MNKTSALGTYTIKDSSNINFSACEYSKFKFGDSKIGKKYGYELFKKFISLKQNEINNYDKIYVYSSPYDFLPTATNTIFKAFFEKLSKYYNNKIIENRKIHRNTTYTVDYGKLSKEERMKLISNDLFELDNNFDGTELLIFLDDIKITGSHEYVVKRTLKENKVKNDVVFLYHAILINEKISPTFENFLNYNFVKGVNQLIEISKSSDFVLNTRFTKYILKLNDSDLNLFMHHTSYKNLDYIIEGSLGNKYQKLKEFNINLKKIIKFRDQNKQTH